MKFKDGRHEVVAAGTFFESADEISDGNVEFIGVNHRRIEKQTADRRRDYLRLRLGHAEQHLEANALFD